MRWGCLGFILLFAGAAWLLQGRLQAIDLPHATVFASVLALGLTLSLGCVQGIWQAWRRRGEPESNELRDGALVRLSGVLRAEGAPVHAPISGREALFVRYEGSTVTHDGNDVAARRPRWNGQRCAPCRLHSRLQGGAVELRLRGFPSLRSIPEQQFSGAAHHPAAARLLAETAWQLAPELVSMDLQGAAQDLASGPVALINRPALERLQLEIGRSTPTELMQRLPQRPWVYRERVVPEGQTVTVIGTWRAEQGALDIGYGPQTPLHEIVLGGAGALAHRQFLGALAFAAVLWALTAAAFHLVLADDGARVRAWLTVLEQMP